MRGFISSALRRKITLALSARVVALLTEKLTDTTRSEFKTQPMRFENMIVANLFLATIFVMALIGSSIPLRPCPLYSEQEKRKLASFPKLDFKDASIFKFASQFESFYNDHYPVRLPLTSFENMLNYRLFHVTGRSFCAFGNKDWIIYSTGMLPTAQENLNKLENEQLERFQAMYQARRDILESKNIKYVLIIAPEKGTIYPEFMPVGWTRRSGYSRLEQLQSALRTSHINFVNAAGLLAESKRVGKWLYYSNDSHWNMYGAFQIAQALFSNIESDFKRVKPFSLSEFELKDAVHTGDLAIALALPNLLLDKKSPTVEIKQGIAGGGKVKDSNEKPPVIREADSELLEVPVAFEGNNDMPRAFVQHDSFMAFLRPYLAERFSYSEYHAVHTLKPSVVFARKPDIVIDEIAERHLYDRQPESVPLFITDKVAGDLNKPFADRLLLQSAWTKWTPEGLQIQMLWQTKKEQKLDTAVAVSASSSKIESTHVQDFYQRNLPAGASFSETFILPLTDNSLKQTVKIQLFASDKKEILDTYQFELQKYQNKQSPIALSKTSYSCPGETFN